MGFLDIFRRKEQSTVMRTLDITDEEPIREKLNQLCDLRQSCNFLIGDEMFTSVFLRITDDLLLTDLMIPLAGNTLLRTGQGLRIGFLEKRMPYAMNCLYQGRVIEEGYEALSFTLPQVIRYGNRRSYFRVTPNRNDQVRVLFDLGISQVSDANVVDISGGGVAVRSRMTNYLQPGSEFERVDVVLPNGQWVSCKGTVVRLKGQLVGIRLDDISYTDRRAIIRYVAERQQDEISRAIDES